MSKAKMVSVHRSQSLQIEDTHLICTEEVSISHLCEKTDVGRHPKPSFP